MLAFFSINQLTEGLSDPLGAGVPPMDWPLYALLLGLAILCGGVLWVGSLLMRILARQAAPSPVGRDVEILEQIEGHLAEVRQNQGAALDLRRIEHLLADVREGNKRLYEQILSSQHSASGVDSPAQATAGDGRHAWPLADRVVARLSALDFERIEILTPKEQLLQWEQGDGQVLVEARRSGATYKGRIPVQGGSLGEIQMRPSHTIFP